MISVEMTVSEAIEMITHVGFHTDLGRKIVYAISAKCGEYSNKMVLTVNSMNPENMIPCIKALRNHTRWGLKEAKDFFDIVRGRYYASSTDTHYSYRDGRPNSLTLPTSTANQLAKDLRAEGCIVTLHGSV